MKTCICCGEEKPRAPEFFYYRNKSRGWLSSWCIECRKKNRQSAKQKENEAQNKRRLKKACKECGTSEKEKGRSFCSACFKRRKAEKKRADKCIYKSRLRKATPTWADKDAIRAVYRARPDGMHVDHIVPIRGKTVCGLHVSYNLQYLTHEENMLKSNHFSLEHEGKK